MSTNQNEERHWAATSRLTIAMLVLWAIFAFGIHFFAKTLNGISLFGFPLGYYLASQGALIVFVAMLFVFASAQDKIDRDHGVAEDE